MRHIKLDSHSAMPMYFIKEKIKGLDYKINFSDITAAQLGDELELGNFIFRVDELMEQRPSPLNYPTTEPVIFHSTKSKIVRRIETQNNNGQKVKVEVPVTEAS